MQALPTVESKAATTKTEISDVSFCSIPEHITRAYQRQRLHHAYLLHIPNFSQNRLDPLFALLLCQMPVAAEDLLGQKTLQACQSCPSCLLLKKQNHPDHLTLGMQNNAGNKISAVAEIREKLKGLYSHPRLAKRRIIHIHRPERLSLAAQNSLLKSLEEPASFNLFILESQRPYMLLATVRSRCFTIHCPQPLTLWQQLEACSDLQLENSTLFPKLQLWLQEKLSVTEILNLSQVFGETLETFQHLLLVVEIFVRDSLLLCCEVPKEHLLQENRQENFQPLSRRSIQMLIGLSFKISALRRLEHVTLQRERAIEDLFFSNP